uniref:Serine/arginine repetitive matrix protein 2-like n=1 Tax=Mesocestoides corti TaxID=53468 RepID=A0A5K3FK88_MESCO
MAGPCTCKPNSNKKSRKRGRHYLKSSPPSSSEKSPPKSRRRIADSLPPCVPPSPSNTQTCPLDNLGQECTTPIKKARTCKARSARKRAKKKKKRNKLIPLERLECPPRRKSASPRRKSTPKKKACSPRKSAPKKRRSSSSASSWKSRLRPRPLKTLRYPSFRNLCNSRAGGNNSSNLSIRMRPRPNEHLNALLGFLTPTDIQLEVASLLEALAVEPELETLALPNPVCGDAPDPGITNDEELSE